VIPAAPLAQAIARSLPRFAYGASTQASHAPRWAIDVRAAARDAVEELKLRAAADAMWRKVEELS
jgi:hypothetical protein